MIMFNNLVHASADCKQYIIILNKKKCYKLKLIIYFSVHQKIPIL